MPRVTIHIDESSPLRPTPVLVVGGRELRLSHRELMALAEEIEWAREQMAKARCAYYRDLVHKYADIGKGVVA